MIDCYYSSSDRLRQVVHLFIETKQKKTSEFPLQVKEKNTRQSRSFDFPQDIFRRIYPVDFLLAVGHYNDWKWDSSAGLVDAFLEYNIQFCLKRHVCVVRIQKKEKFEHKNAPFYRLKSTSRFYYFSF